MSLLKNLIHEIHHRPLWEGAGDLSSRCPHRLRIVPQPEEVVDLEEDQERSSQHKDRMR